MVICTSDSRRPPCAMHGHACGTPTSAAVTSKVEQTNLPVQLQYRLSLGFKGCRPSHGHGDRKIRLTDVRSLRCHFNISYHVGAQLAHIGSIRWRFRVQFRGFWALSSLNSDSDSDGSVHDPDANRNQIILVLIRRSIVWLS